MPPAILSLPPELLPELFLFCLPGRIGQDQRRDFQSIRSVCSLWRSVCFSAPQLWSSLWVDARKTPEYTAARLQQWFARAGPFIPLQLEITNFTMTAASQRADEDLVSLVHSHQSRWLFLSLCIGATSLWRIFFEAPLSGSWASLNSLTLFSHQARHTEVLQRISTIQRLKIQHATYIQRWTGCETLLAHDRLQELSISVLDEFMLPPLSHIALYPHLTKLHIDAPFGDNLNLPDDRICIPHLTTLSVSTMRVRILEAFKTPLLSELAIELNNHTRTPQHQYLENFLIQGCTDALKAVALNGEGKEKFIADMVPVLASRPSIVRLNLERWPYNSFVEVMQAMAGVESWCPNMTEIGVSIGYNGSISNSEGEIERMRSLIHFLEKRGAGEEGLTKLVFTLRPLSTDFPNWLFQPCKGVPKPLVMYTS
ncbi:hypothetical protein BKA70DRAFT_1334905 [Coprinopsis sp. MPI-PUGE-AT-0042]|nr:hypothetical protein BKA70DRAFT_1334905 [Coprinopsis sp. MPI-PUGE-AT-0042]